MHLSISVIKFDEKLSILASLSLSINRRNYRKSKWGEGGSDFPLPRLDRVYAQSIQTYAHFKFFCVSVQLAPLDQLLVFVLWGYVALATYFETSETYLAV